MTTTSRSPSQLTARTIVAAIKSCGITHLVGLPDTESNAMFTTLASDPEIELVPVCREGEAFGVVVGLTAGGIDAAVLIQSTGFFESGDSVRALAVKLALPMLLVIGYRGYRPDDRPTDTAAVYLEPVLSAWGIPYHVVVRDEDASLLAQAYREAQERSGPVAVLIGAEYVA